MKSGKGGKAYQRRWASVVHDSLDKGTLMPGVLDRDGFEKDFINVISTIMVFKTISMGYVSAQAGRAGCS